MHETLRDFDRCGCSKPAGWWGSGGWHLRRLGAEEVHHQDLHPSYAGTPVAMEPCPAYQAAIYDQQSRERVAAVANRTRSSLRA